MELSDKITDTFVRSTPNYGTTTAIDDKHRNTGHSEDVVVSSGYCQFRLLLYLMLFLARSISYALRVSLSQALVAMVNSTSRGADVTTTHNVTNDDYLCPRDQAGDVIRVGEFDWDRNEQGAVLGAFYYGYALTQVPGGWVADRFGGTWLLGGAIAIDSILAALVPAAAHLHVGAVIVLRALAGVIDGVSTPTAMSLLAGHVHVRERSRAVAFIMSGTSFGTIVGMLVGGVLCDHAGWPSVFYVFGLAGCVWAAAWVGIGCVDRSSSTSGQHNSTGRIRRRRTPWKRILTSRHVWACVVSYMANTWGFVTLLTCLPMYLSDVLGYNMTENGLLSTLPYAADCVVLIVSGQLADFLLRRGKGRPTTGFVRKSFCAVGLLSSAVFICLPSILGCRRVPIILCLVAAVGMLGLSMPSMAANSLDLSLSDAGTLLGLSNSVGNAAATLAPLVVGTLTLNRSTRPQWSKVFAIVAVLDVVGAAAFVLFGSGRRQDWGVADVDDLQDAGN